MFKIAENLPDIIKAHVVRGIVFVEEQQTSYKIEVDEYDSKPDTIHIIGEQDGEPFAAARIRLLNAYVKFERIAIRKGYRGKGLGRQLLSFMIKTIQDQMIDQIRLHAQVQTTEFYKKYGFVSHGDVFMEAGIEHILMIMHGFEKQ